MAAQTADPPRTLGFAASTAVFCHAPEPIPRASRYQNKVTSVFMRHSSIRVVALAQALVLVLVACTGTVGDPNTHSPGGAAGTSGAASANGAAAQGGGTAGTSGQPGGQGVELPSPSTRHARLTHRQWSNTVVAALGVTQADADLASASFRQDPTQSGFAFDNFSSKLEVDSALWGSYQRAASTLALQVTGDAALLSSLLGADTGDATARARSFIENTGRRLHRRPLTNEQVDEYLTLFQAAPSLYDGLDAATAGARLTLEAMLQSPFFLYRIEASSDVAADVIPLDGYELAQRLSYLLWDAPPDAALYAAAEADMLRTAEQVGAQAARMLADPRARDVVAHFHAQLMDVERYKNISPSSAFFPDAPANLGALAAEEQARFVQDVAFVREGGLRALLTSNDTFVNDALANLYGLSGSFGATFAPAALPDSERRGILTQIGFLASNATSANPDPIHRGVFVARRILCLTISAPPEMIPPLPPAGGRTNRETVEQHTEQSATLCATCHKATINPLGFPFEGYDALGAFRTTDNGLPVDASSAPRIDGAETPVDDALGLVDAIAASTAAHACYAQHWLEFALGRQSTAADAPALERLGAASREDDLSIKSLLAELVRSRAFMSRSTQEELPP
jgi:Protein of unknown function (DUF1592)/Protein of unknown function (DUF1588)/Protein of unknown function (DUF1595)/Protein of unknown function (DUF1585)/Protein of unknown function (DUF1587)